MVVHFPMHPSDRGDAQHQPSHFTLTPSQCQRHLLSPSLLPSPPVSAVPVAVPVAIPFTVPVLLAIERQEQCERIGQTSLLEKRLIIIQQLIVINEGQPCSFDEASVRADAAGVHGHRTAE